MKIIYITISAILFSIVIFFTLNYTDLKIFNETQDSFSLENQIKISNIKKDTSYTKTEKNKLKNLFYKESDGNYKIFNDNFLPYHAIKLKKIKNKIFYLIEGKLYFLDLEKEESQLIDFTFKIDLVDIEYDENKSLFLLDKSNKIYSYNFDTQKINIYFIPYSFPIEPDPQIVKILFVRNDLYALDPARNQIWKITSNLLEPFFKKDPLVWILKKNDRNISDSNSFYFENGLFYILKRKNVVNVYNSDLLSESLDISLNSKYGYLGMYSNKNEKEIYFIGGYNGSILSINKSNHKEQKFYKIDLKNESLPAYDFFISENKYYILAGNHLIIKKSLKDFEIIKKNIDILENYFRIKGISNYKIPIDIKNIKLPDNAGLFPGARRLYRYGTHEGIDFFTESENKIFIDRNTKVVSCNKGKIIRIDSKYKEITIQERRVILDRCKQNKSTSNEDANLLKGRQIIIEHENKIYTSYCHLSEVNRKLKVGDYVDQGQFIGFVGNSGTSDGVLNNDRNIHLHFEIHIDDIEKNFDYYLGKTISIEETIQIYRHIFK